MEHKHQSIDFSRPGGSRTLASKRQVGTKWGQIGPRQRQGILQTVIPDLYSQSLKRHIAQNSSVVFMRGDFPLKCQQFSIEAIELVDPIRRPAFLLPSYYPDRRRQLLLLSFAMLRFSV